MLWQMKLSKIVNEMGYTETQAYNAVYSGGLSIITTQNVEMQKICEEELSDALQQLPFEYRMGHQLCNHCDSSGRNTGQL